MTSQFPSLTRRSLLGGGLGVGALALAGCGGTDASPAASGSSGATLTVQTQNGPVVVPANPQRVATLYPTSTDIAILLDLPIVLAGTARGGAGQGFATYEPQDKLKDAKPIAVFPEISYEEVTAAHPDMILADFGGEYATLSKIAPTIWYDKAYSEGWRQALDLVATGMERKDKAEAFVTDYDKLAAEVKAAVTKKWGHSTIAELSLPADQGKVQVIEKNGSWKLFGTDFGFTFSDVVPDTREDRKVLPFEQLGLLAKTDILLLFRSPANDGSGNRLAGEYDAMKASPLWQRLPAVKAGRVFEYPAELAYTSPLTAQATAHWIQKAMLG